MGEVTKDMIKIYDMKKLGYDFMGYTFKRTDELSFHHLIVAKKYCEQAGLGKGVVQWNGAILVRDTAHDYLHLIQRYDEEIFKKITNEMIDENIKNRLDIENLKRIRDLLLYFEYEYDSITNSKNKPLIKEEYKIKRISLKK